MGREFKTTSRLKYKKGGGEMKLKIDGFLMYGDYNDAQIDKVYNEMKKPQSKRLYIMGIEFSRVNEVEVLK